MKFAPMAIPALALALLQQHDTRQDILIEPAARRRAAVEARGAFRTGGVRNWGRNRAVKTNQLVCLSVCLLATLCKNFRMDLHEIFREGWQWANEQMIKFLQQSGSVSGYRDRFLEEMLWWRYAMSQCF